MGNTETGKKRVPEDFSLESFAEIYVSTAFELARTKPSIADYDNRINEEVAKRAGISLYLVKALHHPFHWTFFLGKNGSPIYWHTPSREHILDSRLREMSDDERKHKEEREASRVLLREGCGEEDIKHVVDCVLTEYENLLRERARAYGQAAR